MENKVFLKNFMEDCVWAQLPEILSNFPDACQCEICKKDIVALALNSLPPKYVVHDQGEVYAKIKNLDTQYNTDICTELTKAIITVSKNHRHNS